MGVLAVIGIEGGPSTPTSRLEGSVQVSAEGSFDQALIDRIVFGRWWIPDTYHLAIAAVVLVFALEHWTRDFRWTPGAKGDGQCRWRKGSAPSESSPLLESLEQKTGLARHGRLRLLRLRLRAVLTYQPRPIPFVNKILPSNATSLLVLLLLGINIFYLNYYTGSTLAVWTACILDRAGLLFVANLPWLYLLAAKNQPLRLLTGHSYESLNILHRRLGEWMCLLAVFHVMGFFAFWWYYASPVAEDPLAVLVGWLLQGFVLIGIGAFVCYEALWATSLASFRQWWYECFLASHVVLQAAGLVLVFLHHPNARNDALVALAIFVVDRGVYRATSKSRTLKASVIVLDDGETILLSADWPLTRQASLWRRVLGKNIKSGWKPLEHVFITAPDLGRGHSLQAHPFTIASAAPERNQEHAWLSLIIRARDGFTRDLLRHARSLPTLSIRFDGPYGSQDAVEMLRQSHTAILVAGGSGIAVAYPVIWSLLHDVKAESACGRSKRAALVWIVREASHISWIGKERLDELRELGLHLVLPEPTTNAGRPDVQRLLLEAMEDTASGSVGENIGVVVSAPDAMNREVNTTCARLAWGPTSYFCSFRLQDSISPDLTIASASEQPTLCNRTDVTIAADQPPTVDIDKEGDVLLAVGDPIEIQLRVSSAILSKTSKVFAALFSPRFSEGQELGVGEGPKIVRLPEDDPAAMSDICLLLHGEEVESLSSTATSKRILSYAIAVDKYHCLKALRLYSQGILLAWLDRNQKQTDEGAAEARIAAAAYLLEHRRTFSLTTERLMQQWNWPLYLQPKHQGRDYFDEELMQALPLNALFTIEQRRALAREEVGPILLTRLLARKCRKKCPHDSPLGNFATLAYVAHITGIAPWPPELGRCRQQTIRGIIEILENRTDQVITSSCTHRRPMIIPACDFRSFANELRRLTRGLCLDRVKEGSMQSHLCVKTEHGRAGS